MQINDIITKTFVINLKNQPNRWKEIKKAFKASSLKLQRWYATDGKKIPDKIKKRRCSELCYLFCSPGMIGCWYSHYLIWKYMVKNKLTNVLVLEDDAVPVENFDEKLLQVLKQMPSDYDLIFLGILDFGMNQSVTTKKKNEPHKIKLVRPKTIVGTHAYLISLQGAKKLLKDPCLEKIQYHIDIVMARCLLKKKQIKILLSVPYLVNQKEDQVDSQVTSKTHTFLFDQFRTNFPEIIRLDGELLNWQNKFVLTLFGKYIITLSFLLGLIISETKMRIYLSVILIYYLAEFLFSKNPRNVLFELCLVLFFTLVAMQIKKYVFNLYNA